MAPRTALHNTAFSVAGQAGARLLALAFYPLLARSVGPNVYGDIGTGTAVAVLFLALLEPGLNPLLVRDVARAPEQLPSRFAESLGYKLTGLLVAWPAMLGLSVALGYRGNTLIAVVLSATLLMLQIFEDLCAATLVALGRLDFEGTLRLLSKVCLSGPGLAALALGGTFRSVLGAVCAGAVVTGCIGMVLVRLAGVTLGLKLPLRVLGERIGESWPLALGGMLWLVTLRLDQLLASQLGVDRGQLGDYNASVKLVEALLLFPYAVSLTFQPLLSRAWQQSAARCAEEQWLAIDAGLTVTLPLAIGGALLAGPIGTLIYGDLFGGVGPLLALQLLLLPIVTVQYNAFNALISAGALRAQALSCAVNLIVNVICNLVLVPRVGIIGASVSALAGGVASIVLAQVMLIRLGVKPTRGLGLLRVIFASALMGVVVFVVRNRLPFFVSLLLGVISYAIVFVALGGMSTIKALLERRTSAGTDEPASAAAERNPA
jgi:O-antigen/teichoic acid export membrane protein